MTIYSKISWLESCQTLIILCPTSRLTDLPIAIDLPAFRTVHAMANTSQRLTEW